MPGSLTDRPQTEVALISTTGLKKSLIDLVDPMEERKSMSSDHESPRKKEYSQDEVMDPYLQEQQLYY